MCRRSFLYTRFRTEPDEVNDFQDADRVDDQESDKPPFLRIAGGVPERIALDGDGPERRDDDDRDKREHELGRERGIKRRVWLHMSGLYHTLQG